MESQLNRVYLALGSNLGDRKDLLNRSVELLERLAGHVVMRSNYYETEPWGFVSEHVFLNAVLALDTTLSPDDLLLVTQRIERMLGRVPKVDKSGYADRPVDIDILFYNDEKVCNERLTIPHPLLHLRSFVLDPLAEIAPFLYHPVLGRTVLELQKLCHENEK